MGKLNYLFFWIFRLIACLPLYFFYMLSPILFVLLYYIFAYRKKVVFTNLHNAFPEKSDKEITKIAKAFYWHLGDLLFENIKLFHWKQKELENHLSIKNGHILDEDYKNGRNTILVSGHYNNWEMMLRHFPEIKHHNLALYHPLRNKFIDKVLFKNRGKTGTEPVAMQNYLRRLMECNKDKILTVSWFIADQTAPPESPFWTTFLNQDTPFFIGAEKIARKFNYPVYYMNMKKVRRGVYEAEFTRLFDQPKNEPEFAITREIVKMMEEEIKSAPEYWLWSHRRWKHKRPETVKNLQS
jgi:Kdo2-lipid IVA lauroyltransferase/acyltransferase